MKPAQPAIDEQIEQLDSQLITLLAERQKLVRQKDAMDSFASRQQRLWLQQAQQSGLSTSLAMAISQLLLDDIRIHQVSHSLVTTQVAAKVGQIVVVGGHGAMGRLFVEHFQQAHYAVAVIEQQDWQTSEGIALLQQADVVLIAVPIHLTQEIIQQLPVLKADCLLVDITSIKEQPLATMLAVHTGPVLGLHPMFGPNSGGFHGQVVIYSDGRAARQYQWLLEQLAEWGAKLYPLTADIHDRHMALIQALRHFATFSYGIYLKREQHDLSVLLALSSPIYRLELAMTGRLFAQNAQLYADIIFSSDKNRQVIEDYHRCLTDLLRLLKEKDKQGFIRQFQEVSQWFGGYADYFMQESQRLLTQQAN